MEVVGILVDLSEPGKVRLLTVDFPILFCGLPVVHMAVHTRTLASVRTYTWQCTHVHLQVDDGMCTEKNRECGDL